MDRRQFLSLMGGSLVPTSNSLLTEELRTAENTLRALDSEISQSPLPSPQAIPQLESEIDNHLTTARPNDRSQLTYPFDEADDVVDTMSQVLGASLDPVNRMLGHVERRYAAVNNAIAYYSRIKQVLHMAGNLRGSLRDTDRQLLSDRAGLPQPGLAKESEVNQREQFETNTKERNTLIEARTSELNRLLPNVDRLEEEILQLQKILFTHASVQREYIHASEKITRGIQQWEEGEFEKAESLYQNALAVLETEIPGQLTGYRTSSQSPSLGGYQRARSLYQDACNQFKRSTDGGASNDTSITATDTGLRNLLKARTQLTATVDGEGNSGSKKAKIP